jgi:hypothetical protein
MLGFQLPGTLLPANAANPTGFWESSRINDLNNQILEAFGQSWISIEALPNTWPESDQRGDWLVQARKILEEDFAPGNIILKDPRLSRLLPAWLEALEEASKEIAIVCVVRHPSDVAKSLKARNGFELDFGQLLWLRYYLDAEQSTRGKRRAFLSYQNLLLDWQTQLDGVVQRLDLERYCRLPPDPAIGEFLNADLEHHRAGNSDQKADQIHVTWAGQLFAMLSAWCAGEPETAKDHLEFDRIRGYLDEAAPNFAHLVETGRLDRKRLDSTREQLKDTNQQLQSAVQAAQNLDELKEIGRSQADLVQSLADQQEELLTALGNLGQAVEAGRGDQKEAIAQLVSRIVDIRAEISTNLANFSASQASAFETNLSEALERILTTLDRAGLAADQKALPDQQMETLSHRLDEVVIDVSARIVQTAAAQQEATSKRVGNAQAVILAEVAALQSSLAVDQQTVMRQQAETLSHRLDEVVIDVNASVAQTAAAQQEATSKRVGNAQAAILAEVAALQSSLAVDQKTMLNQQVETLSHRLDEVVIDVSASITQLAAAQREMTLARVDNAQAAILAEVTKRRLAEETIVADLNEARVTNAELGKRVLDADERASTEANAKRAALGRIKHLTSERDSLQARHEDICVRFAAHKDKIADLKLELARLRTELDRIQGSPAFQAASALNRAIAILSPSRYHAKRRRKQALSSQIQLIASSRHFDEQWYLATYSDVAEGKVVPAQHYLVHGWQEGRDPSPTFSTRKYLLENPDVAEASINPLLHFIQHGLVEGRAGGATPPPLPEGGPAVYDYGDAHVVQSFARASPDLPPWLRALELEALRTDGKIERHGVVFGQMAAGISAADKDAFEALLESFEAVSFPASSSAQKSGKRVEATTSQWRKASGRPIVDGNFINRSSIRLRLAPDLPDRPSVQRAYQFKPLVGREAQLVGESIIYNAIDHIDICVLCPFSPVLLTASDEEGNLESAFILAFPSLLRGGLHYSEALLWSSETAEAAVSPLDYEAVLLEQLQHLPGKQEAWLSGLLVDLNRADGTEILFDQGLRHWLVDRLGVGVRTLPISEERDSSAAAWLVDAMTDIVPRDATILRTAAVELMVRPDCVPTLAALITRQEKRGEAIATMPVNSPVIEASLDIGQPAQLVDIPWVAANDYQPPAAHLTSLLPIVRPAPDVTEIRASCIARPVAAIRYPKAGLTNVADLFMPIAPDVPTILNPTRQVRVLAVIPCAGDDIEEIADTLGSLANQSGPVSIELLLLSDRPSEISPEITALCSRLFEKRWKAAGNVPTAAEIGADMLALIRGTVTLHDRRTIATLAALAEADDILAVSCLLISSPEDSKTVDAKISWSGTIGRADLGQPQMQAHAVSSLLLTTASYPVLAACPDFWIARTSKLGTLEGESFFEQDVILSPVGSGPHNMCLATSLVSASCGKVTDPSRATSRAINAAFVTTLKVLR